MFDLKARAEKELRLNILPFWLKYTIDEEFGGFRGRISNDLVVEAKADKGLILNARILWTFSKAFSVYREDQYLRAATRAYRYILRHFWDEQFGGVYWMLNYRAQPWDMKKRIYGQAFTVYALAEYYEATGSQEALRKAIHLYEIIEETSHDGKFGGYFETYERDWTLSDDQRLSEVDMDEKKSMNTHLHMMEAYANLSRACKDPKLGKRLRELIEIFLTRIIDPKNDHFLLFFEEDWRPKTEVVSFGHDIEGSWLLCEAAKMCGDRQLIKRVENQALRMAQAVCDQAVDSDGGILYAAEHGKIVDNDKHWWPQTEAVIGFLNAFQLSGNNQFRRAAERSWEFIETHMIDRDHGEWFWKVSRDGVPSNDKSKVDPWKGPYHNSRTCFEIMARIGESTRDH
ncbi:MAG TPA: AGE family epimerase/isomerase [Terriglobales bacterium]|nr:AGE family epimerase/isomerase [Terriglobales bacterium]